MNETHDGYAPLSATANTPVKLSASDFIEPILSRFWAKVNKDGPIPSHRPELGPCWVWTAGCFKDGYGAFSVSRKLLKAHRVSFVLANGEMPKNAFICHHCDNPSCVNPSHLWHGDHYANMKDMKEKSRAATGDGHGSKMHPERVATGDRNGSRVHPESRPRGEDYPQSKLNEEKVRAIRFEYGQGGTTMVKLGAKYQVANQLISRVISRGIWKHVI